MASLQSSSESLRPAFLIGSTILGLIAVTTVSWALLLWSPFPEIDDYLARPRSIEILDRHGEPLGALHPEDGTRRYVVALDDLPEYVIHVFLTAEDKRFFRHPGIDVKSVLRAAVQNLRARGTISGASTITMQLARIVSPHEGGFRGKLTESWNALRLEARYSKDYLLELYFNGLPFGAGTEGIESAARHYFGRPASELSPEEAVVLSVMPRRPSHLHPHHHPHRVLRGAMPVASRAGMETDSEHLLSVMDEGRRRSQVAFQSPAPHFCHRVAAHLSSAQRRAGGSIRTTLDLELQTELQSVLFTGLQGAEGSRIHKAAGLVLDHNRGEVLAYVGSLDYFDLEHGGMIDATRVPRSSGSTLKPFLYALALENGLTAATILPDLPRAFGGEEAYIPQNSSRRFAGPVRLRTALSSSLNIPAVHTVVQVGVSRFVDTLETLDFEEAAEQRDHVGSGIAVGNLKVNLFELTRAFSVFPRDGVLPSYTFFPRDGGTGTRHSEPSHSEERRVFSRETGQIIRDILSDQAERVLGFGPDSVLNTDFPSIAKTGTANQFSDVWALASDPDLTIGVWMGNVSGETVVGRFGGSLPAATAVTFLSRVHKPGRSFPPLDAVHAVNVSPISGMRHHPPDGGSIQELFPKGFYPPRDTWHTAAGGIRYPPEFQAWADDSGHGRSHHAPKGATSLVRIESPNDGARFHLDPHIKGEHQKIEVRAITDGGEPIQLYWNGALTTENTSSVRHEIPLVTGHHRLTAVAGQAEHEITFRVGAN